MDNKYQIRVCSCGTIHFIPEDKIDKALEENKNLLWLCGNCGQGTIIGGDEEPNDFDDSPDAPDTIYSMYSVDFNPNGMHEFIEIQPSSFEQREGDKGLSEIFYSRGIKVPMKTGYNARYYNHANRYFMDTWAPDWYKIERKDITLPAIVEFIEDYRKECREISMPLFIRQTDEKYLKLLASNINFTEFNWTGTKYEELYRESYKKVFGDYPKGDK